MDLYTCDYCGAEELIKPEIIEMEHGFLCRPCYEDGTTDEDLAALEEAEAEKVEAPNMSNLLSATSFGSLPDSCDTGDREQVGSYLGRYFGDNGDELGEMAVWIIPVLHDSGIDGIVAYIVAEGDATNINFRSIHATREAAEAAAEKLAAELDETPDLDEVIEEIRKTGYFDHPDIIPDLVKALTQYSQGYLLVTPDIGYPVGTRWTTNGYLQCEHMQIAANYDSEEEAAEALLAAIKGRTVEDDES